MIVTETAEFKALRHRPLEAGTSGQTIQPRRRARTSTMAVVQKGVIRFFDVLIALLALMFLLPVLAIVAIAVKAQDGGPCLYAQKRIGKHGREFKCLKFRSMLVDSEARLRQLLATSAEAREEWEKDHKLKNDPRITGLGRFLRKTSLDEFPQLINVLRGEMSLVGPRPIVQGEVYKYGRTFGKYTSVMPGITGLWQVTGRNDVTYSRRVAMDRMYVRRYGVVLYLYILFVTIPAVLAQRGSY